MPWGYYEGIGRPGPSYKSFKNHPVRRTDPPTSLALYARSPTLCHQPSQRAASYPLLTLPAGQLQTQPAFLSWLRTLLQACELTANDYSGHSFRRGAASAMFQAGLPGDVIQIMEDWKSDAYKLYLDIDIDSKFK